MNDAMIYHIHLISALNKPLEQGGIKCIYQAGECVIDHHGKYQNGLNVKGPQQDHSRTLFERACLPVSGDGASFL